jgi:hypothetical protein
MPDSTLNNIEVLKNTNGEDTAAKETTSEVLLNFQICPFVGTFLPSALKDLFSKPHFSSRERNSHRFSNINFTNVNKLFNSSIRSADNCAHQINQLLYV